MTRDDGAGEPGSHHLQLPPPPTWQQPATAAASAASVGANRAGLWVFIGLAAIVALGTALSLVMVSIVTRADDGDPGGVDLGEPAPTDNDALVLPDDEPTLPESSGAPSVSLADVPAQADDFTAQTVGEGFVVYTSSRTSAYIAVSAFDGELVISDLAVNFDGDAEWDESGRSACGIQGLDPICLIQTQEHGVVYVQANDSSVSTATVRAIARGIVERNP